MYEYAPSFVKKKEKRLCYGFLGLGALLFAASMIDPLPVPWVLQILAVASFVPMVAIFSICLSRRYTYRIDARGEGMAPDLIVTEYCGKRVSVVARISVTSVKEITPVTKETRGDRAGKQYFSYTGVLFDEKQYDIYAEECGVSLLVRICADDTLLEMLGGESAS